MRRFVMLAIAGLALFGIGCGSEVVDWTKEPWPDGYTMPVNEDVEIRFAYPPSGSGDAVSRIYLWHIETTASLHVDPDGQVVSANRLQPDSVVALCAVLSDDDVMARAQAKATELSTYFIRAHPLLIDPCEAVLQ